MSRVDGPAPEAVRIGLRVRVHVAAVNGTPAPVFTVVADETKP